MESVSHTAVNVMHLTVACNTSLLPRGSPVSVQNELATESNWS